MKKGMMLYALLAALVGGLAGGTPTWGATTTGDPGDAEYEDRGTVAGGLPRLVFYSRTDEMTGSADHYIGLNPNETYPYGRIDIGCNGASEVNEIRFWLTLEQRIRGVQSIRVKWDQDVATVQTIDGLVGMRWSSIGISEKGRHQGFEELLANLQQKTHMEVDLGKGSLGSSTFNLARSSP